MTASAATSATEAAKKLDSKQSLPYLQMAPEAASEGVVLIDEDEVAKRAGEKDEGLLAASLTAAKSIEKVRLPVAAA